MANLPIVDGAKMKGSLNMFGTKYDYFIGFHDVDESSFKFQQDIYQGSFLADSKSGNGTYKWIDDFKIEVEYNDPETSFKGILDIEKGTLAGETEQTAGFYSGTKGSFIVSTDQVDE